MPDLGKAIIVGDLGTLELGTTRQPVYDRDFNIKLLYQDPESGAEHYLIRYPPGLQAVAHRHTAAHTIVVLVGELSANGVVIGPGSYAHFPGGEVMHHAPAGDGGCLFVLLFDGPFDVEPAE